MRANAARRESEYMDLTTTKLFRWQQHVRRGVAQPFVLHDGPPYANGQLHIGHFLNKCLKDMTNRYNLLRGRYINFIPGWDCHGLPIELKALAEAGDDVGAEPLDVRERAARCAEAAIADQRTDLRRWGVLADWECPTGVYTTMDPRYEARQLSVLTRLLRNGLVHRGLKPVWWSPSSRTALAEAELEYRDDHESLSAFVGFELLALESGTGKWAHAGLKGGAGVDTSASAAGARAALRAALTEERSLRAVAWTTTPWTIPSNAALCVHSDVEYVAVCVDGPGGGRDAEAWLVAAARIEELRRALSASGRIPTGAALRELARVKGAVLAGSSWAHPLASSSAGFNSARPMLCSAHVTIDSGTGIVHTAPAHGADDEAVWRLHGGRLETCASPVDAEGRFTPDVPFCASEVSGLEVLSEGNTAVLSKLRDAPGNGALVHAERIVHRYPYDWRSKRPVLVRATRQWFVDVAKLYDAARGVLLGVNFVPQPTRQRLEGMLGGRDQWCISRQRPWGVPVPAFFRADGGVPMESGAVGDVLLTPESVDHFAGLVAEHGSGCWWSLPIEELLPPSESKRAAEWVRGVDTLDVWFDSGCSWSSVLGDLGVNGTAISADVYLEGSDQHRGWFQSSLLTYVGASNGVLEASSDSPSTAMATPYRTLITHGFVLDEKGRKMSKSLGNTVDPSSIINGVPSPDVVGGSPGDGSPGDGSERGKRKKKEGQHKKGGGKKPAYGADVLRFWCASSDYTRDVVIGPTSIKTASDSLRKLRNVARFILGNLEGFDATRDAVSAGSVLRPLDRYLLHRTALLSEDAACAYEAHNPRAVVSMLQRFAASELSGLYLARTSRSVRV